LSVLAAEFGYFSFEQGNLPDLSQKIIFEALFSGKVLVEGRLFQYVLVCYSQSLIPSRGISLFKTLQILFFYSSGRAMFTQNACPSVLATCN